MKSKKGMNEDMQYAIGLAIVIVAIGIAAWLTGFHF